MCYELLWSAKLLLCEESAEVYLCSKYISVKINGKAVSEPIYD